nr:PREDICTED: uncharacterized protein LOC107398561 [Tribolium castaneum]|eukprot:XP_015838469.1 PREDICTED: uncharacterized protein LOC107398561 [Tribolium castaneum]
MITRLMAQFAIKGRVGTGGYIMDKVKLAQPLAHLNIIGLDPLKNDRFSKIRTVITVAVFALCNVFSFSELFLHYNNPHVIVRSSEVVFPFFQNDWKIAIMLVYKKNLAQLIQNTSRFWQIDAFGKNYQYSMGIKHKYVRIFYLVYRLMLMFSCSQYILLTIGSDRPMILSFGETGGLGSGALLFYLIFHIVYLLIIFNVINGFDGLFFFLVAHVLSELQMVKVAFSSSKVITFWNHKRRFKSAIQHHRFVLDYINRLNSIYSILLLNQHISCLFGICFGLYLFISDGFPPDYEHISKYVPYVIYYITQVWVFCFAGQLIIDWSVNISDEIFYHDWTLNRTYENKTDKLIIIQRAQHAARLSLAGYGNLDLQSFNLVLKNGLSFFTFVNAVIHK